MAKKGGNPQNLKTATLEIREMAYAAHSAKAKARRKLAAAMMDNVTEEEVDAIISSQKEQAIAGDRDSATWVIDRLLGKVPTALVSQDEDGEIIPIVLQVGEKPMQPKAIE